MARAALVMDRLMARAGLPGRAFIPLMSSFACAIPGIMAARTIGSRRDRMTTILIAPFMSCSARLPVYTLMIGNFVPDQKVFGFLSLRAATMFSMYVLGILGAMAAAFVFKRTLFKGKPAEFMIELPDYKIPAWRNTFFTMWQRASQFISNAGTIILAISVVLWFMLSYPKPPQNVDSGTAVSHSFAGRIGHAVEPLIAPLGFNWKIGIGLIGAMSAREVFVSTMGTVYSVEEDAEEDAQPLREQMREDRWPDGRPVWTLPAVLSILVFFVFAMQCVSTLAVVRRETDSWKWPLFMLVYMTGMAWILSFIVYQTATALGW
jgi:ferrous iron transport protein B